MNWRSFRWNERQWEISIPSILLGSDVLFLFGFFWLLYPSTDFWIVDCSPHTLPQTSKRLQHEIQNSSNLKNKTQQKYKKGREVYGCFSWWCLGAQVWGVGGPGHAFAPRVDLLLQHPIATLHFKGSPQVQSLSERKWERVCGVWCGDVFAVGNCLHDSGTITQRNLKAGDRSLCQHFCNKLGVRLLRAIIIRIRTRTPNTFSSCCNSLNNPTTVWSISPKSSNVKGSWNCLNERERKRGREEEKRERKRSEGGREREREWERERRKERER